MGVNGEIDLTTEQRQLVLELIERHFPDTDVWAYGSRVTWLSRPASDLDLVVFASPAQGRQVHGLRDAFKASDLPFQVDIVVWDDLAGPFQKKIEKEHLPLSAGQTGRVGDRWYSAAIGDIADVVGGGTPSTTDPSNFGGSIPWITPRDLAGKRYRYVTHGSRNLSAKGLASCSACLVPPGTVLLSSRAPIGYVAIAAKPLATNQGFQNLIPKRDRVMSRYLYYWLIANIRLLESHASGSTFQELSASSLKSISIPVPPFSEQQSLVSMLSGFDDLIELNRQMNIHLDAMVHATYRRWCSRESIHPGGD